MTHSISVIRLLKNGACFPGTLKFMWLIKGFRIKVTRKNIIKYYTTMLKDPASISYLMPHGSWYRFMEKMRWNPQGATIKEFIELFIEYTRPEGYWYEGMENP